MKQLNSPSNSPKPRPVSAGVRSQLTRRQTLKSLASFFATGVGLSLITTSCGAETSNDGAIARSAGPNSGPNGGGNNARTLRVGYQKSSTALNLLKTRGSLEERLQPEGVTVTWNEFVAGPQMLEALNVGSIDFAYTGETPPVFAQAAQAPLVYAAYEPLGPAAEAILVTQDSPIQTVADLAGKRVALNRGSNVHYLLVRALEDAGLAYEDIETVFLPPGDARPAFEQGSVDAWVIWDPFQAAAEVSIGARVLADGTGLVSNNGFFLSTESFASDSPDLLQALLDELDTVSSWAADHADEVVTFMSAELGIDQPSLALAEERRNYGVLPLSEEVVTGQQAIADVFFQLQLIPQEIDIASAVWQG